MKIQDILTEDLQQLDEIGLKRAMAAGAAGISLMGAPNTNAHIDQPPPNRTVEKPKPIQTPDDVVVGKSVPEQIKDITDQVTDKYGVNPKLAHQIVKIAYKYQKADFPTLPDILSIIDIESNFDPSAQSQLAIDPAMGLMQLRPGQWNLDPSKLASIEGQIKYGTEILNRYFKRLGNEEDAIKAYNVGLTNFLKGKKLDSQNRYLTKFRVALADYSEEST